MTDALRTAVAELRREAAELRAQADKRDTAATTLEALLDEGRIAAPPVARRSRAGQDSKPKTEPKPKAEPAAAKAGDWSPDEDARMKDLRAAGHTWGEIGRQMGRTETACIQRDFRLHDAAEKARQAKLNGGAQA